MQVQTGTINGTPPKIVTGLSDHGSNRFRYNATVNFTAWLPTEDRLNNTL